MKVTNHGVPEDLKEAVTETCKELFSLPEEEKAEYMEAGPMDPIRVGSGFNSVVDDARYWRDYLKMFVHRP
jgi:isopenicillin N synthase-like dioxygenase